MSIAVGSSASLVTTVFETLGYAYQSYVLSTLADVLARPAAELIFVGLALAAGITFVVTGKGLKQLIWVLVGPALLWSILFYRTETTGPSWKFGRAERNQAQVTYEVRKSLEQRAQQPTGQEGTPIRVSGVFAFFNRVVSSITSEIISSFTRAKGKIDARFILRTELAANLRGSQIADPRLQAFIQQPLLRGCGPMIRAARDVPPGAARSIGQNRRNSPLDQFEQALNDRVRLRLEDAQTSMVNIREQLEQSRQLMQQLQGTYPSHFSSALGMTPDSFGAYLKQNFQPLTEIAARTETSSSQEVPEVLTCQQVWNITHLALLNYASIENERYQEMSRALLGNDTALLKDLTLIKPLEGKVTSDEQLASRAENLVIFNRVLASYLLRNELTRASPSGFISEYTKKGFEFTSIAAPGENDMATVERGRAQINEVQERTGIFTILCSLPYYQGLLLYILAALFPFFALMVLIPGRIKGFLLWFFLWIWAKSWDIGFAAAMLLDDTLFSVFSSAKTNSEDLFKIGLDSSFASVIWSMHELDPAFSLGAYYALMSTVLGAIPVASSLLVMGAMRGGASLIAEGSASFTGMLKGATDANFTQRLSDDFRKDLSVGQIRMAEQLAQATNENASGNFTPGSQLPTPGLQYQYQSGNYNNQATKQTISDYLARTKASADAAGLLSVNSFDDKAGSQLQQYSGFDGLADFSGRRLLKESQVPLRKNKTRLDAEAQFLKTAYETDYEKRLGIVTNAALLTPTAQRSTGRAMIGKTIGFPAAPDAGDEEKMLQAEHSLYAEKLNLEAAEIRAELDLIPTTPGQFDGYTNSIMQSHSNPEALLPPQPPLEGARRITSLFGDARENNREHAGIDLVLQDPDKTLGAPIRPTEDGYIIFRGQINGYGNTVVVQHNTGLRTLYAHLDSFSSTEPLTKPEKVTKDSVLGTVGNTGSLSRGAHLHFEVITGSGNEFFYLDPKLYLENNVSIGGKHKVSETNSGMNEFFRTTADFFKRWDGAQQERASR